MAMPNQPLSRKLPHIMHTQHASKLSAISKKTSDIVGRIEFLKSEGHRMRELLDQVPEESSSRLAWLSSRLHAE